MRGHSPLPGVLLAGLFACLSGAPAAPAQSDAAPPPPAAGPAGVAARPQAAPRPGLPASRTSISDLLQPALPGLNSSLAGAQLEHWKLSGSMRDEMARNIDSIRRDLNSTLPGLLQTADAAPGSLAAVLPVFRNIDALYDVVLRVSEAARQSAPKPQADALDDARQRLVTARGALGDQMQSSAQAADARIRDLQTALNTQASGAANAAAQQPCPPATTAKKKRH